ncbi:MAG: hypothetical protein JW941_08610 [Candidatus Coatesbacteria bacterium]|nr:hypothetical protein [Candidatus Coatesbacteria bacterium]
MYRIPANLCNIMLIVLMATMVVGETPECNWDETPVLCSIGRSNDVFIERGSLNWYDVDKEGPAIRKFIAAHYKDGRVIAKDWRDAEELFLGALMLSSCGEPGTEQRRKWLEICLKAMQYSLKENPDTAVVGYYLGRMEPGEEWFFAELIEIFKSSDWKFSYPAIRFYNLAQLYAYSGDFGSAQMAIDDAYTLCPNDSIIVIAAKHIRKKAGDFKGALLAIDDNPFDIYMNLFGPAKEAQDAYEKGKVLIGAGETTYARANFLESWKFWGEVARIKKQQRLCGVPTVGLKQNRCATELGLIALQKSDIEDTRRWLEASLTYDIYMESSGYDMRLVKKTLHVPELRAESVDYLKAACALGTDAMKANALLLLTTVVPDFSEKDIPPVPIDIVARKRLMEAFTKRGDGRGAMREGDLSKAKSSLLSAWTDLREIVNDEELRPFAYQAGAASDRNDCATLLGLIAHERGDIEKAAQWLRASSIDVQKGHAPRRYHLELVEKLSWEPIMRDECIRYLELALKADSAETKKEAKKLLDKLKGAEKQSSTPGKTT